MVCAFAVSMFIYEGSIMSSLARTSIAFAMVLIAWAVEPALAQNSDVKTDWQEQYAYALGTQAYVFGFPYAR
jgi:hypothetical protein